MQPSFERRLAESYGRLSARLQQAGDYLAANPVDTASRSLRTVAEESGISPATFSRLARALGYDGFEDLREAMRTQIGRSVSSFAARADDLRQTQGEQPHVFLDNARSSAIANLNQLAAGIDTDQLDRTAARLATARNVLLLGALGSTGIAEYAGYMGNFLGPNWKQIGRMGASIGSAICDLDAQDALIVITKAPYATVSIRAAEEARRQGVYVVVIASSHTCPALRGADSGFIVPSDGPNFFSSYVATVFLLETLVAMVARGCGPETSERIAEIERQSRVLGEVIG
ncbi:MurR/RpiR family transcriptional regulator [Pseudodonghicola flavimaris]|uniref:MurR/RpiR family transcriptional regulator n=1 Tax=Pseudodonghicola flavimaris TaxID=3050036 RepID=A0ABT7F6W1_9RHOB|nr:MurR/RpiR family transcriptional regulator [Pseudodonghicola flavimaris]MDK3020129.1 MurR/RpiR family transcriptional regulator [Pseudodonghicola flavimaris]